MQKLFTGWGCAPQHPARSAGCSLQQKQQQERKHTAGQRVRAQYAQQPHITGSEPSDATSHAHSHHTTHMAGRSVYAPADCHAHRHDVSYQPAIEATAYKNASLTKLELPLTEWISHMLGPVGVWALTGHVALHREALQRRNSTHSSGKVQLEALTFVQFNSTTHSRSEACCIRKHHERNSTCRCCFSSQDTLLSPKPSPRTSQPIALNPRLPGCAHIQTPSPCTPAHSPARRSWRGGRS